MPCPLFLTDSQTCEAQPETVLERDVIRKACSPGYARNNCVHAGTVESDATRLLIKSHRDGIIEVAWSLERDHHPVAVGSITVTTCVPAVTTLEHQAHALASEYLRRKGQE